MIFYSIFQNQFDAYIYVYVHLDVGILWGIFFYHIPCTLYDVTVYLCPFNMYPYPYLCPFNMYHVPVPVYHISYTHILVYIVYSYTYIPVYPYIPVYSCACGLCTCARGKETLKPCFVSLSSARVWFLSLLSLRVSSLPVVVAPPFLSHGCHLVFSIVWSYLVLLFSSCRGVPSSLRV